VIAGFGGELISHAYVEQLLSSIDRGRLDAFSRALVRWWRHVARTIGPASSARAIHDTAVVPLLQLLDHRRPDAVPGNLGIAGMIAGSSASIFSVPWSTSPRAIWRDAVRFGSAAGVPWALICNGRSLRIVDCTRPWTKSGIEFDFAPLTLSPNGIAVLWLLASASSLAARGPASLQARIRDSDAHASGVCRSLSDGVIEALPRLAAALARNGDRSADAFDQALTVIYRILFLLFAESRSLVPVWHEVYRQAYTIDTLTRRAAQSQTRGLWEALQAISRLAHSGCSAGDLSVTAFNGRLFSPRHAPLVEKHRVPDDVMRDILLALATDVTSTGRRRISFYDLGVEQLGSVYERVLEYEPCRRGPSMALTRTSTQRKSTGSFYTPQALTDFLVRRTLAPLVAEKSCEDILRLRILDPAMGSGAFLVAACRYLADCGERAMIRDGQWRDGDDGAAARATLRRHIAERCLYGVDLNPTAVQLARVSLWLTTLAAERPLTFLDHHLACGNSLIGAWLPDLSMPPRSSKPRISLPLFDDFAGGELVSRILPARLQMALDPSDSVEAVRKKERALADLTREGALAKWTAACDAWCAAALWPRATPSQGLVHEWIAMATGLPTTLPPARLRATLHEAVELARSHAAFHWELAFPEIFFDGDGRRTDTPGFDAVIGNPPWDMLRADIGTSDERSDSRAATDAALRFFRASRSYRHHGKGHPNRYQVFVERALTLARRGGRIGLLLPSGIATDHGSAALRRHLLDRTSIDTWLGFDNRHRIFPIHRSMRFVLLSTTNEGHTGQLRFRCGLTSPDALHDDQLFAQALVLSRSRLDALDPDHVAIPEITNAMALSILTGIADRVPALGDPSGWNVKFGRELNATDDRPRFLPIGSRSDLLAIVEGKQLSPFQVDLSRSTHGFVGTPLRARIAYRDVASATNKLTLIAAMLPANAISTHTVFCLKTALDEHSQWALLGLLNSFVANFLVRLNVTTHVTSALMSRLRVPRPNERHIDRLAALSRSLNATGIDHPSSAYAELNALAATLYGVTTEEYAFILESFPLIAKSTRDRCLKEYSSDNTHGITETRKH
jgi:hypothetical protein